MCQKGLSGSSASGSVVWLIIVGHVRGNKNDGVGDSYKLPKTSHREEGTEKQRWEVGNNGK